LRQQKIHNNEIRTKPQLQHSAADTSHKEKSSVNRAIIIIFTVSVVKMSQISQSYTYEISGVKNSIQPKFHHFFNRSPALNIEYVSELEQ